MWDVDANVFVIRLMRLVLERRCIQWIPASRLYFIPLPYRTEDGYVEKHLLHLCVALEKLSSIENEWDLEEYEQLYPILATSEEHFVDFFVNCVSLCYLKEYSPFNYIRYLRYVIDFSIFCFKEGFPDALNCAAICIARIIFKLEHVFIDFENWKRVLNEVRRINRCDFQHPYLHNTFYIRRKSDTKREVFDSNLYRRQY